MNNIAKLKTKYNYLGHAESGADRICNVAADNSRRLITANQGCWARGNVDEFTHCQCSSGKTKKDVFFSLFAQSLYTKSDF